MSKADVRRWSKARKLELRELMWEWDPLGLVGAPEDEYDCVVDGLLSRLVADPSHVVLAGVLASQSEHFGGALAPPAERAAFAERLPSWWSRLPPRPAMDQRAASSSGRSAVEAERAS